MLITLCAVGEPSPIIHFSTLAEAPPSPHHVSPRSCAPSPLISFSELRADEPARAGGSGPRRVAVIGFHNVSRKKSNAWLARELPDSLAEKLGACAHLRFLPREPLQACERQLARKGAWRIGERDAAAIRRRIGADLLVIGRYLVRGKELVVEVKGLRDGWGDRGRAARFTGPADRVWEIEAAIAGRLAGALGVTLDDRELVKLRKTVTENALAFEELCRGRQAPEGSHRKIQHLQKAIEADPSCAEAHYLLASAYCSIGTAYQYVEWYNMALDEYRKAAALSPDSARIYCGMGMVYMMNGCYDLTRKSLERALELDPNMKVARGYLNRLRSMGY